MPPTQTKTTGLSSLAWLGRLFVALISCSAAVASLMRSYGAGPFSGFLSPAEASASWIGITPGADTAYAIGDTLHLAATVTDSNGTVVGGAPLLWTSDDGRIATVGQNGLVIARGAGTTTVIAALGDRVARARITVHQSVRGVRVNEGEPVEVRDGAPFVVPVRAVDARGYVVEGRGARWRTADTTIATVDSTGRVLGVNQGRTMLAVTIDTITVEVPVTVAVAPASLVLVGGNRQRNVVGKPLPSPVVVRALSKHGRPVVGVPVRFRPVDDRSSVEPAVATTNADGVARVVWTLGELPGRQRMLATVDQVDSALVLEAEADPIAANTRVVVADGERTARAGSALPDTVVVQLTDSAGRALAGVPVTWETSDGTVTPDAERTDSLGKTRARWTLGTRAGVQRVRILVGSGRRIPPLVVKAVAQPGPPTGLEVRRGDAQRGTVGKRLANRIVVAVVDRHGNATPGVRVAAAVAGGELADSAYVTDSTGTVSLRWTLPRRAGVHQATLSAEAIGRPLTVKATAVPGAPSKIAVASQPGVREDGTWGGGQVLVTVSDEYGNPVPEVPLSFRTDGGTVEPSRIATSELGTATARWTLGRTASKQTLTVEIRGRRPLRGALTVRSSAKPTAAPAKPAPTRKKAATRKRRG